MAGKIAHMKLIKSVPQLVAFVVLLWAVLVGVVVTIGHYYTRLPVDAHTVVNAAVSTAPACAFALFVGIVALRRRGYW